MSTNPPIVPVPGREPERADEDAFEDDTTYLDEGEGPIDPDADPDEIDSAEADERAATEGEIDGSEDR